MRHGAKLTSGLTAEVIFDANFAGMTYTHFVSIKKVFFGRTLLYSYLCVCYNKRNIKLFKENIGNVSEGIRSTAKLPEITLFQCFLFVCLYDNVLTHFNLLVISSLNHIFKF